MYQRPKYSAIRCDGCNSWYCYSCLSSIKYLFEAIKIFSESITNRDEKKCNVFLSCKSCMQSNLILGIGISDRYRFYIWGTSFTVITHNLYNHYLDLVSDDKIGHIRIYFNTIQVKSIFCITWALLSRLMNHIEKFMLWLIDKMRLDFCLKVNLKGPKATHLKAQTRSMLLGDNTVIAWNKLEREEMFVY